MSIRRGHLAIEDQYTTIPNAWVRDARLSRKARGLLVELMSHREGWEITIESLVKGAPEGRESVRTAIAELESAGYLRREQARPQRGRFGNVEYVLQDPPSSGFPTSVNPSTKKTIQKKDLTKTSTRQSPPIAPPVATDAELSPVQKIMASRAGITNIGYIAMDLWASCARHVTAESALQIGLEILNRAKNPPRAPGRYIAAAIAREPFVWQKYIDERGLAITEGNHP